MPAESSLNGKMCDLNWFVQQRCNVFFSISMRCAEHHNAVLYRQRIQVIQHNVIRFRQQGRLTLQKYKRKAHQ